MALELVPTAASGDDVDGEARAAGEDGEGEAGAAEVSFLALCLNILKIFYIQDMLIGHFLSKQINNHSNKNFCKTTDNWSSYAHIQVSYSGFILKTKMCLSVTNTLHISN